MNSEGAADASRAGPGLGTSAVFLTTISTILGAILFLRFGYAVANLGFLGTAAVVVIGHLVTVPTALAIWEIATNQRVQGGGVYYIISRSFGLNLGGAIGIALFFAQAISVAFYAIAFAQAFVPAIAYLQEAVGIQFSDSRWISVPTTLFLMILMFTRGAAIGVRALYPVVGVLFVSLVCFFAGANTLPLTPDTVVATIDRPDGFFLVFAICFPAFTGLTSGVGLSGDLRDSRRSIPAGTLAAVAIGFAVYLLAALKLAVAASPEELASDQLVMSRIAIWGPIIPIGLAAATLSSALGSILVAPRTLQAVAADGLLPSLRANRWLSQTSERNGEPIYAVLVTSIIAVAFALLGDIDFVAQIISMFFMVSYGAICLISAVEHFAAEPSYRPSFRSRWYISLLGAFLCVWLMFQMSPSYAVVATLFLVMIYRVVRSFSGEKRGLASLLRSAGVQLTRRLQVTLQTTQSGDSEATWRPAAVCISEQSFDRTDSFEFMRWLAHRYGFATYIHLIKGYLSRAQPTRKAASIESTRLAYV